MMILTLDKSAALASAKAAKLADLAARRWSASATFTYAGVEGVSSDDTAQSRLTATIAYMQLPGAPATVGWEISPGVLLPVSLTDLQTFGGAMGAHVQACWSNAQSISSLIMAASSVGAVEAVEIANGWPG